MLGQPRHAIDLSDSLFPFFNDSRKEFKCFRTTVGEHVCKCSKICPKTQRLAAAIPKQIMQSRDGAALECNCLFSNPGNS